MPSPDLVAEQNSLGRSESKARRDKAFDAMREALEKIAELRDDKIQDAPPDVVFELLDIKVSIARAALALAEKAGK